MSYHVIGRIETMGMNSTINMFFFTIIEGHLCHADVALLMHRKRH
jgi:hypothetical protein